MESNYNINIQAHQMVHPTQDEITEALAALVRGKVAKLEKPSKTVSTFTVDVITNFSV
jgi:ribosome-associated translation inhibitor RaiA